jgi:hypothetical protein
VLAISRFAIAVIDSPLRLELTPIDKDSALIMECILLTNHNDTLLSASVCTFDRLSVDSCCLLSQTVENGLSTCRLYG